MLVAYLRLVRSERGVVTAADRWLLALPLGPFFGWITAANAVSLTSEAVDKGLVDAGSTGEIVLGSGLLLLGGTIAAVIVLAGRNGPPQAYLAYGATVLWALAAIVVNQYDESWRTACAALLSAAAVTLSMLRARRTGQPGSARGARTVRQPEGRG